MEVHLEHNYPADVWLLWVTDRGGRNGGRRIAQLSHRIEDETRDNFGEYPARAEVEWIEFGENAGAQVRPTMTLPSDWLEAIVAAGNAEAGIKPPNTSQADHLADAVTVRDRLLTLIERSWPA